VTTVKRTWATTAEVCEAAKITDATAMKWSKQHGVLPPYKTVSAGRRGRAARWPLHAPAQAAWVADLLGQGFTFEDIRKALADGHFVPDPPPCPEP
jgi:hypothetical protein